jgi:hypothetical protein
VAASRYLPEAEARVLEVRKLRAFLLLRLQIDRQAMAILCWNGSVSLRSRPARNRESVLMRLPLGLDRPGQALFREGIGGLDIQRVLKLKHGRL